MDLIWHGTAAMEVVCGQGKILFDPFVPLKGSPVKVSIDEFDGFSDIFVTHCHLDHIVDLPEIAIRNPGVIIHGTRSTVDTLIQKGVPEKNLSLLRYGETLTVNGFTLRALHGKHAVLPKADCKRIAGWIKSPARRNALWLLKEYKACQEKDETVFYQIEADGKTVSHMGSMNLRDQVAYPTGADALLLPYNGWTDNLPPAVRTIERLKPKNVLLHHYDDTFPPVSSSVDLSPIVQKYPGLVRPITLRRSVHL
jgi:L-ascorbate metabolism protein UlaG (beta-lactamase superfamily)